MRGLAAPPLSGVEITVLRQRLLGRKQSFARAAIAIDRSIEATPVTKGCSNWTGMRCALCESDRFSFSQRV
jgi:hypothetical protein